MLRGATLGGLPTITYIPVASYAVWRIVRAMSQEEYIVHQQGVSLSCWRKIPYKRASGKAEGGNLTCRGITFLPPDAAAPLLYLEGNLAEFSRELFPWLVS